MGAGAARGRLEFVAGDFHTRAAGTGEFVECSIGRAIGLIVLTLATNMLAFHTRFVALILRSVTDAERL